jgi:hypothetical protein
MIFGELEFAFLDFSTFTTDGLRDRTLTGRTSVMLFAARQRYFKLKFNHYWPRQPVYKKQADGQDFFKCA